MKKVACFQPFPSFFPNALNNGFGRGTTSGWLPLNPAVPVQIDNNGVGWPRAQFPGVTQALRKILEFVSINRESIDHQSYEFYSNVLAWNGPQPQYFIKKSDFLLHYWTTWYRKSLTIHRLATGTADAERGEMSVRGDYEIITPSLN